MIRPFGERSLLVEVADAQAAQALAATLAVDPIDGVEGVVPALASVLVELEDRAVDRRDGIERQLHARLEAPAVAAAGRLRAIPVVYGGEHGPDLAAVAETLGLAPEEVVRRHASAKVRVLFCGFAPGFAYLGELPPELAVPRLETPRTVTPRGSVAIAGSMTGVYPAELPGGWRVIGRTPIRLFDPHRDPPAYLVPGDLVRFTPIDAAAWAGDDLVPDDW